MDVDVSSDIGKSFWLAWTRSKKSSVQHRPATTMLLLAPKRAFDFVQVLLQVIPVQNLSTFSRTGKLSHDVPDPIMSISQAGQRNTQRLGMDPID